MSYGPFKRNERHLYEHFPDVPVYDLDVAYWRNRLSVIGGTEGRPDVINTTCPCAGLSITSSQSNNHGADSTHNEWMYRTSEMVLGTLKPKVFYGENAPGLFAGKGAPVVKKLREIGKKHGYSFSMVFTDSRKHGLPQRRPRTFYFFWRKDRAPKFRVINKNLPSLADFMRQVQYPKNAAYDKLEFCKVPLVDDIWYQYAVEKWGEAWRSECDGRTIIDTIRRNELWEDVFAWAAAHASEHVMYPEIKRHKENLKGGKGVWDESPKPVQTFTPAIMFKNVKRIVHPTEDRFLNVRELMALMGFPVNFNLWLDPEKDAESALDAAMHHISQNVPVGTAADMATYIQDVLEKRIPLSDSDFYLFDNTKGMRLNKIDRPSDDEEDDDGE